MPPLSSRITLVTGASRGIGRSIALALADAGADVVVNYNSNSAAAESVCNEIRAKGCKALSVQAGVSKTQDVEHLISAIKKQLGSVGILVNNAGIAELLAPEKVTEAIFERFLRANFTSMFLVTQHLIPGMRAAKMGADSASRRSLHKRSASSARTTPLPRPAFLALPAPTLFISLAKDGITVNAPSLVETDMAAGVPAEARAKISKDQVGTPDFSLNCGPVSPAQLYTIAKPDQSQELAECSDCTAMCFAAFPRLSPSL